MQCRYMDKLTINESNILNYFYRNGVRFKNPVHWTDLILNLKKHFNLNMDEINTALRRLEELNIVEGNGSSISLTEKYDKKIYEKRGVIMDEQYTIEDKKAARLRMLEKIYQETGGSESTIFEIFEIGRSLDFTDELTEITSNYLSGQNLIKSRTIGGGFSITHNGIVQYEKAVSAPEKESDYFPPYKVINDIKIFGDVNNAQILAGIENHNKTINKNDNFDEIRKWIQSLEEVVNNKKNNEIFEKIKDDIDIIKMNINAEKPNVKYIGIALRSIEGVLIGLASNTIFQMFLEKLRILIP